MKKLRSIAIFAVVFFHIPVLFTFLYGDQKWKYALAVLIALFGDICLSFWQMEITTGRYGKIGDYARAFLPYFLEKLVIVGAECIFYIIYKTNFNFMLWWIFCTGIAALSALVTFVTGAARTMLYHDER